MPSQPQQPRQERPPPRLQRRQLPQHLRMGRPRASERRPCAWSSLLGVRPSRHWRRSRAGRPARHAPKASVRTQLPWSRRNAASGSPSRVCSTCCKPLHAMRRVTPPRQLRHMSKAPRKPRRPHSAGVASSLRRQRLRRCTGRPRPQGPCHCGRRWRPCRRHWNPVRALCRRRWFPWSAIFAMRGQTWRVPRRKARKMLPRPWPMLTRASPPLGRRRRASWKSSRLSSPGLRRLSVRAMLARP
mmetsp:Transcript_52353/g.111973  ORF Transcript_52353/g.111973 Transcript_52353/m.111973 type:complete len:243 (-) Transcript_52353:1412-2140(-)